jgi:uroporphyrinogen-III synthase
MSAAKHIVITRPAHQAGPLIAAIKAAGGLHLLFPTLEIESTPLTPDDKNILQQVNDYDIIIFISPNAVEYGLSQINTHTSLNDKPLIATIGPGSAAALNSRLGKIPDITPQEDFNSEGLLATQAMQNVANKRILIIRGNAGREHLKESLEQRGATVNYLNVYRRTRPQIPTKDLEQQLQNKQIAAIVITSATSIKNLLEMVPATFLNTLLQVPLVLINDRLIKFALEAGFTNELLVAAAASDEAIVETLIQNKLLP